MPVAKIGQKPVAQAIESLQWTLAGDDAEAAAETRRRARLAGPDCVAFLYFVMKTDKFASTTQRVRATNMLLDTGEFLSPDKADTGLSREAEQHDTNGHDAD